MRPPLPFHPFPQCKPLTYFILNSRYTNLAVSSPWLTAFWWCSTCGRRYSLGHLQSCVVLQGQCFGGPVSLSTLFYTPNNEGYGKSSTRLPPGVVPHLGSLTAGVHCSPKPGKKGKGSLSFLKPASLYSGICSCQCSWNVILMTSILSSVFLFLLQT